MIVFDNVTLTRGGATVLSHVSLRLTERRIGIVGANGSGKSSLCRLINGLLLPTTGQVRVFDLDTRADAKAIRREVGFVFQNPDNQIVYPTVGEDLAFGLKNRGIPKAEMQPRIAAALAERGLGGFEDRLVHELSGGQRQLVALAGVLVLRPRILVLDEPTTLLDLRNTRMLMRALDTVPAQVVMATHDLSLLSGFDRVICFDGGVVVQDGRPDAVLAAYWDMQA
ncbi:ABC transporter ATP-binding protein [Aureimonas sp. OT7]|uniref:energy-coupling factor ABC transporter ATP-binding protein n=1 Tax=Aureimonas sp. OT7 TaxID=2816454 RepID=UPI001781ED36|nr:ABC transporter ATP-binding protein [Aureimonas sp. OT7]QOG05948.1 ABC transporter ATP-binding protein [Aureimonas sp. OT7]